MIKIFASADPGSVEAAFNDWESHIAKYTTPPMIVQSVHPSVTYDGVTAFHSLTVWYRPLNEVLEVASQVARYTAAAIDLNEKGDA